MVRAGGRVRLARFTLEDHAYGASRLPKTTVLQSIECIVESDLSLRSWRYCKRTRNKVLAAEPTSERRSCEENRESFFEILWNTLKYSEVLWNTLKFLAPKLYFARAISPATQAKSQSVLYFGWPNQPSSGTMGILHLAMFLCSVLPEICKTSWQCKLKINIYGEINGCFCQSINWS